MPSNSSSINSTDDSSAAKKNTKAKAETFRKPTNPVNKGDASLSCKKVTRSTEAPKTKSKGDVLKQPSNASIKKANSTQNMSSIHSDASNSSTDSKKNYKPLATRGASNPLKSNITKKAPPLIKKPILRSSSPNKSLPDTAPVKMAKTSNIDNGTKKLMTQPSCTLPTTDPKISSEISNKNQITTDLLVRLEREKESYEKNLSELRKQLKESQTDVRQLRCELQKLKGLKSSSGAETFEDEERTNNSSYSLDNGPLEDTLTDGSKDKRMSFLMKRWERQNLGDISSQVEEVNTLHDRIHKMEETNFSTSEELQATLQELYDMQKNNDDMRLHNTELANEKNILLELINDQNDKVENLRLQVYLLKSLLPCDGIKADGDKRLLLENEGRARETLEKLYAESEKEKEDLYGRCQYLVNAFEDTNSSLLIYQQKVEALSHELQSVNREHVKTQHETVNVQDSLRNELSTSHRKIDGLEEKVSTLESSLCDVEQIRGQLLTEKECLAMKIEDYEKEMSYLRNEQDIVLEKHQRLREADRRQLQQRVDELEIELHSVRASHEQGKKRLSELCLSNAKASDKHREEIRECKRFEDDLLKVVAIAEGFRCDIEAKYEKLADKYDALSLVRTSPESKGNLTTSASFDAVTTTMSVNGTPIVVTTPALPPNSSSSVTSSTNASLLAVKMKVQSAGAGASSSASSLIDQPLNAGSVKARIKILEEKRDTVPGSVILRDNNSTSVDTTTTTTITTNSNFSSSIIKKGSVEFGSLPPVLRRLTSEKSPPLKTVPPPPSSKTTEKRSSNIINNRTSLQRAETVLVKSTPPKNHSTVGNVTTAISENREKPSTSPNDGGATAVSSTSSSASTGGHPLDILVRQHYGASKRNALLKWCQLRLENTYKLEITNFSVSWASGLAFAALYHSYRPDLIKYNDLAQGNNKREAWEGVFEAGKVIGIATSLNLETLLRLNVPDWSQIMQYVADIFKFFEAS